MKADVVCEPCNTGWMSDIENEASFILKDTAIRGAEVSILPLGIVSIAALTFLKAVIGDHMNPIKPFFSPAARHAFARSQTIPDNVQIWIGQYGGQRARYGSFSTQRLTLKEGRYKGFQFYVFTYVINFMALQLAAWRWIKPGHRRTNPPRLIQKDAWAEAATEIWPSDGSPIHWPPRKAIGDDTIQIFTNRWRRLDQPTH